MSCPDYLYLSGSYLQQMGLGAELVRIIDPIGGGEDCLFDAIEMVKPEGSKKFKAVVDAEQCWGCGVCVLGCDQAALKMKTVRPAEHIPPAPTPAA